MGQEERRNKAKLEKTQISVATSNTEYENSVKFLEETTGRWNREWKAAADKFQDLEEERLDFSKSSLWTFANIASTVCVSDDSSCEKIRLSLEKLDVEKDITTFITERGTGQEIPDPPKYINFCRGDINDAQSEVSDEDNYSVAQFPRSINPVFRSSSPQPSTFESHHDPNSALANDLAHREAMASTNRDGVHTALKTASPAQIVPAAPQKLPIRALTDDSYQRRTQHNAVSYDAGQHGHIATVPHDPYPMDGMTMLCRTGPSMPSLGPASDLSSHLTSNRPSSRDSHSECSNPTSFSSVEPYSAATSPLKQDVTPGQSPDKRVMKKKSGFFQNHSPFRRKSTKEAPGGTPTNRNTWHVSGTQTNVSASRRPQLFQQESQPRSMALSRTASPEPIDANASLALGVGQNVLPVTSSSSSRGGLRNSAQGSEENDPIAMALAELKGVTMGKQSSVRVSADHYHGMATPAPGSDASAARPIAASVATETAKVHRGTPPPSYQQVPVSRLGVPPPAVTSKAMKEATKKMTSQTRSVFGDDDRDTHRGHGASPNSRPATRGNDVPRATSPAAPRSASPQPPRAHDYRRMDHRSASPNPYRGSQSRTSSHTGAAHGRGSEQGYYRQSSPNEAARGQSPSVHRDFERPRSSYGGNDMSVQLAPTSEDGYGSQRGRGNTFRSDDRAMGLYDDGSRTRSKSVADPARQYTRDGRPILHYGKFNQRNLSSTRDWK